MKPERTQKTRATLLANPAILNAMNITEKILSHTSVWEKLKSEQSPIVLYGTGNGADTVLDIFESLDIQASAVCASDGFVRKRTFRGFEVMSISDVLKKFSNPLFCLSFASSIADVMENIVSLSKNRRLLVPVVPVFGKEIIDRDFILKNEDKINLAYSLLADEKSKEIFENILTFEFTGELSYLLKTETTREEALCDLLKLTDKENYADLGAYRGDTVEELKSLCGGYEKAYAFEPDKKTFLKLSENTKGFENLSLFPYALWNKNTTLIFSGGGGRQSSLSEEGYEVDAVALDNILGDKKITYIKADVEGAEKEALEGMNRILKEQKPKLCISAYHRSSDIFELILQIHSINPDYKIHLRHHPYIPAWDTNLYII